MSELKWEQLERLKTAIQHKPGSRSIMTQNFAPAKPGTKVDKEWLELVDLGLAQCHEATHWNIYRLTREGRAAIEEGER